MNYQKTILKINRDLNLLAPLIRLKTVEALAACHEAGYPVFVFEAWRSPERQAELLRQNKPDKFVTNAPPGLSFHQYGLAVDLAYGGPGKWHWQGDFEKPHAIFEEFGFDKPISKNDLGHNQMSAGLTISQIRQIAQASTLQGLWLALGLA